MTEDQTQLLADLNTGQAFDSIQIPRPSLVERAVKIISTCRSWDEEQHFPSYPLALRSASSCSTFRTAF